MAVFDEYGKEKWSLANWFFGIENPVYHLCSVPNKANLFEENKFKYINIFPKTLHVFNKDKKFSKEVDKKVQKIWNHINIVWCSRKKDQFEYIKKWLSFVITGTRRMKTAIYLKSDQGVGKSCIVEFIENKVLRSGLVFRSSDVSILGGRFNSPLQGKLLYVAEELPCSDKHDWHQMDGKLKNYITDDKISIEKKGKDHIKINNTISFIINTNNDYAIKMGTDDRRYFAPDVSSELKDNAKYFEELFEIFNSDEVGEAFYHSCWNIVLNCSKFNEKAEMPTTDTKKENISDNALSIYQFIKDKYILKGKPLNKKYSDFYQEYIDYCNDFSKKYKNCYVFKKIVCAKKLISININYVQKCTKHNGQNCIHILMQN